VAVLAHIRARLGGLCGRFLRAEQGAALVEMGLILPSFVVFFAVAVEGGRMYWSYQAALSGVRDATRYMARVMPVDICASGGSVAGMDGKLTEIVRDSTTGGTVFPRLVTIEDVTPVLDCIDGDFRVSPAPVGRVTARVAIEFPFAGSFAIIGLAPSALVTEITDATRVFGA